MELGRPNVNEYYMLIAMVARARAQCVGHKIGAVLVSPKNRIISTGYNGTPEGMNNCPEGCVRCQNRSGDSGEKKFKTGEFYDICICVHAEQNAILSAARQGISTEDATLYTTLTPCFGCAKELIQAKVKKVYYLDKWSNSKLAEDKELKQQYDDLIGRLHCEQIKIRKEFLNTPVGDLVPAKNVPVDSGHMR